MDIELKEWKSNKIQERSQEELKGLIKQCQTQKKFERVVELSKEMKESVEKYLKVANALLQMRKWKELIQCCDTGLKMGEEVEFIHLKGKAFGKLGEHQKAVQLISKAIKIRPNIAVYHRNIGATYYSLKQYELAIEHHKIAIELEPTHSNNYHNLGSAYYRSQQFEKAINEFDKAIERNPKQALSFSWKGDCLKSIDRNEEALQSYQKAYQLSKSGVYLREKEKMQEIIRNKI